MEAIINFVGDFSVRKLEGHHLGRRLVSMLREADANIINLEAPLKAKNSQPSLKSGINLYQDEAVAGFLEKNNFNIIALGNNHIMDYGTESLWHTIDSFNDAIVLGAGAFQECYKVKYINSKGLKIGFLSLSQYEFGMAESEEDTGVAWICHPVVDELIIEGKKECDKLIVISHAGLEEFYYPLPNFRELYKHFIRLGADAVIGGHPHVYQGWEYYYNKPIVYSLGNFCFDMPNRDRRWYQGLLASLHITERTIEVKIHPIEYNTLSKNVELVRDEKIDEHLKELNVILQDEKVYKSLIDKKCKELELHYLSLFEWSGFYKPTLKKCTRLALSLLVKRLLHRQAISFNDAHYINNVRCETHRYILSRIYNLKSGNNAN